MIHLSHVGQSCMLCQLLIQVQGTLRVLGKECNSSLCVGTTVVLYSQEYSSVTWDMTYFSLLALH